MCLYPDNDKAVRAKKDIICYKVVYKHSKLVNNDHPSFTSAVQGFIYRLGEGYVSNWFMKHVTTGEVRFGFHSYMTETLAQNHTSGRNEIILKCVIPKGTLYFTGNNFLTPGETGYTLNQYCSSRVRVIGWRFPDGLGYEDTSWHIWPQWNTDPVGMKWWMKLIVKVKNLFIDAGVTVYTK